MSNYTRDELTAKLKEVFQSYQLPAKLVQGGQGLQIGDTVIPKQGFVSQRSVRLR